MKDISTWTWATIFLFFLLFPPIVLLIREIQFLIKLDLIKSLESDEEFQNGAKMIIIGMILNLIGVGIVIGWIFLFIGFRNLELWAQNLNQKTSSANLNRLAESFHLIAIGNILVIIVIGIFAIAVGHSKAGDALTTQFGGNTSQNEQIENKKQSNELIQTSENFESDQFKNIAVQRFCRHCGAEMNRDSQKFCSKCGASNNP
jgi:hypothetical protein